MVSHVNPGVEEFSVWRVLPTLSAIIVGMLLVMLDSTILNIAMPQLEKSFHTNLTTIQWASAGYTLALSAVIPLAGWFSDRFTARRVFLVPIALFTACSALCALAASPAELMTLYETL
jgi:MFS family permease